MRRGGSVAYSQPAAGYGAVQWLHGESEHDMARHKAEKMSNCIVPSGPGPCGSATDSLSN